MAVKLKADLKDIGDVTSTKQQSSQTRTTQRYLGQLPEISADTPASPRFLSGPPLEFVLGFLPAFKFEHKIAFF